MSATSSNHLDAMDSIVSLPLPLQSIEAEQSVLGALLLDNSSFDRISAVVSEADFYRDDHRCIFRHISRLIQGNKPADVITVHEAIESSADRGKVGGLSYLGTRAQNTPSAHNIHRYAEIVHEHSQRRDMMTLGVELQERAVRGDLSELHEHAVGRLRGLEPTPEISPGSLDLEALAEREPEAPKFIIPDWLPTGYATLLAGHGGVGKSSIA